MTARIRFRNGRLLDARWEEPRPGWELLVEDGVIREVSDRPIRLGGGREVDLAGRTLMPGLIDAHVHAIATTVNLGQNAALPDSLVALQAAQILRGMLDRGFTTVRDAGGADWGLATAVRSGIVPGPRLFIAGRALSQTGGHGDFRGRTGDLPTCACCHRLGSLARVVDGVDAIRQAVRDEMRRGADQIKVMASGGVASPTDPIGYTQYSIDELTAACAEAEAAQTYVMAHAYTPKAISRAVSCGVRTIEHGNLVDAPTAALMAKRGAFAVPTLVTYDTLARHGASLGFPAESIAKIDDVRLAGQRSLEIFRDAGVPIGFGTDLLGALHPHQNDEFLLRGESLTPREVVAGATLVNAEIVGMAGRLGVLEAGAVADLLVVAGDPLADLSLLARPADSFDAVIQGGRFHKDRL